jgi:hypothetical protein
MLLGACSVIYDAGDFLTPGPDSLALDSSRPIEPAQVLEGQGCILDDERTDCDPMMSRGVALVLRGTNIADDVRISSIEVSGHDGSDISQGAAEQLEVALEQQSEELALTIAADRTLAAFTLYFPVMDELAGPTPGDQETRSRPAIRLSASSNVAQILASGLSLGGEL